jgi:hypothetical protein
MKYSTISDDWYCLSSEGCWDLIVDSEGLVILYHTSHEDSSPSLVSNMLQWAAAGRGEYFCDECKEVPPGTMIAKMELCGKMYLG